MKGLDALVRLLLLLVVAWLVGPMVWRWLSQAMPIVGGLLVVVIIIRVLFGRGAKP